MKKIKLKFKKNPLSHTPRLAFLILTEQRHKLTTLSVDWYQEIAQNLQEQAEISLFVCSPEDSELQGHIQSQQVEWIGVPKGTVKGEQYNQGLKSLKGKGFDAVLPLFPGDFLTQKMIEKQIQSLKEGCLFLGLLDLYLFDPNEMKCMYWLRHEFTQGPQKIAPLGYFISAPILKALKWNLWPNQNDKQGTFLHSMAMERLYEVIKKCPQGTCLIQSQGALDAHAFSLKSEFGRAVFAEENWQKVAGLNFADFEKAFEDQITADWIERFQDFDERLTLDILVEDGPSRHLWQAYYEFCIYKFLPYTDVRLNVISNDSDFGADWNVIQPPQDQTTDAVWNYALHEIRKQSPDLVLFAGKNSLVDLKTIEYYLIYVFRNGARLLSVQNFYLALAQKQQAYFWKGNPETSFAEIFGFGTCIHSSYLDALNWTVFGPKGTIHPESQQAFDDLLHDESTLQSRVLFQCASNQLGLIAFDFEGAVGFEEKISLSDLVAVDLKKQIPKGCYQAQFMDQLSLWASASSSKPTPLFNSSHATQGIPMSTPSSSTDSAALSPLERAKALLANSKQNSSAAPSVSSSESSSAPASAALSPLERAKMLLNQSKNQDSTTASSPKETGNPAPSAPKTETQNLSPLERAKALLNQSKESQAASQSSSSASTVESVPPSVAETPLSPLERAKALLQASQKQKQEAATPVQEQSNSVSNADQLDAVIKHTEKMVESLQNTITQARQEVEKHSQMEDPNAPENVLCNQGEDLFIAGHIDQAKSIFEAALRVNPGCLRALNNLGVLAIQQERPYEALSLFVLGLIQDAQNQDLLQNLNALFEENPSLNLYKYIIFDA